MFALATPRPLSGLQPPPPPSAWRFFAARIRERRQQSANFNSTPPPPPEGPGRGFYYGRWRRFVCHRPRFHRCPWSRLLLFSALRLRLRFGSPCGPALRASPARRRFTAELGNTGFAKKVTRKSFVSGHFRPRLKALRFKACGVCYIICSLFADEVICKHNNRIFLLLSRAAEGN